MLGYSFFAMLECEIWLEPKLRARRYTRYIGSVAIIGFAIWFTLSVVFHQAPLHFSATSYSDEHADGVVSDGITWNSRMAELRITIENPSNEEYHGVDVVLSPDDWVAQVVQQTSIPSCLIGVSDPGNGNLRATSKMPDGSTLSYPMKEIATRAGFRVHCENFPGHSRVVLFVSTLHSVPGQVDSDRAGEYMVSKDGNHWTTSAEELAHRWAPPRRVESVSVTASYSGRMGKEFTFKRVVRARHPL